jgi:hypothetical protein
MALREIGDNGRQAEIELKRIVWAAASFVASMKGPAFQHNALVAPMARRTAL